MFGFHIILHSLRMVWNNRQAAIRIGLLPVLVMVGSAVALRTPGTPILSMGHARTLLEIMINAIQSENAFLLMLIWGFASVWTFVNWHRFILLSEYPKGWIPPIRQDVGISYAMAAVKLIGIWVVTMFIAIFVLAIVAGGPAWSLLAISSAVTFLIFRLSPILPAAALGVKMSAGDALGATANASGAILVIMAARYGVDRVVQAVVGGAADVNEGLGLILWVVLTLFLSLVNASILTTLYGYCVQGRSLG
ncbi:hypothetical protein O4H61_06030 [Roseovarius aestuarii]|nr:hypothetical protein [Roseovarius aestuarii]